MSWPPCNPNPKQKRHTERPRKRHQKGLKTSPPAVSDSNMVEASVNYESEAQSRCLEPSIFGQQAYNPEPQLKTRLERLSLAGMSAHKREAREALQLKQASFRKRFGTCSFLGPVVGSICEYWSAQLW